MHIHGMLLLRMSLLSSLVLSSLWDDTLNIIGNITSPKHLVWDD